MHAESGRFTSFGARTQRVLRNAGHGINHGVTELKKFLLLFAGEGIELAAARVSTWQTKSIVDAMGTAFAGHLGSFRARCLFRRLGRGLARQLRFASSRSLR